MDPQPQQQQPKRVGRVQIRRPRWGTAIVAVVVSAVVGVGAATVTNQHHPVYESRSALLADQPQQVFASRDTGIIQKLILLRFKYRDIVKTSLIARPVARSLGISETRVEAGASAVVVPQSLLLTIIGRSPVRANAARLANAVAIEVAAFADREQAAANVPANLRFVFKRVGGATPGQQVLPKASRGYAVGVASGLFVLAGLFFVGQFFAARRRPRR